MNLVVLHMLILVTQLSLFRYGKSLPVADNIEETLSSKLSNNDDDSDHVNEAVNDTRKEIISDFRKNYDDRAVVEKLKLCSG